MSNLAPNETEYSDTNNNETESSISEEDEEKATQNSKNKDPNSLFRKVDKATKYDRDYIWNLVYEQLLKEKFTATTADYAMIYFDGRYKYALENMRFARSSEIIAEYVFNGIVSELNQTIRRQQS